MFEQRNLGVFVVRYEDAGDLAPARQAPLVSALRIAARRRPPAVVFVVGPQVRTIDVSVPTFWLEVTADPELRLAGLAVASPNMAVRVATSGFGAANALRGVRFPVKAFAEAESAIDWAAARALAHAAPVGA